MFIYIFCHLFIVEWVYVVFRSFVTNLQDTIEVLFSFPDRQPLALAPLACTTLSGILSLSKCAIVIKERDVLQE